MSNTETKHTPESTLALARALRDAIQDTLAQTPKLHALVLALDAVLQEMEGGGPRIGIANTDG